MSLVEKEGAIADAFSPLFSATADDVLCNQRVKLYPDGDGGYTVGQILTYNKAIFTPKGWEKSSPSEVKPKDVEDFLEVSDVTLNDVSSNRAFRRARNSAYDYLMSNPSLNMFVTLTFSAENVDRSNYEQIYARLSTWLENRVKRAGLKYILIPEYHADGENIHFHGVMNEGALKLTRTEHKRKGKRVYNIADFALGFTSAVRITGADSTRAVARYCFKYMTKAMDAGLIGGRYYLHGGKLDKPVYVYNKTDFNEWQVENDCYEMKVGKYLRCFIQTF